MKKTYLTLVVAATLVGCGTDVDSKNVAQAAPAATPVTITEAQMYQHTPTQFYVGRMQAIESAKLTPRTTGFLLIKHFEDGAIVEKGDVLFEIDPTSYQAAYDSAQATLREAKAALALATLNHERTTNMLKTGGVSQAQLDLSQAELTMAKSRVESAKANVLVQQDNLDQTQVKAPYSGKLGKSQFSIGDMVGPNFGPLTDLIQISPIEASFSLKEDELIHHQLTAESSAIVSLEIAQEIMPTQGRISFVDNKINPNSGTISIAAEFANDDARYTPNQYVRVGLSPDQPLIGVKIPHAAVHQDNHSQYVMTIEDGTATRRNVEVMDRIGQNVFVSAGLDANEPVIVGALQRIREGAPVVAAE
ncbi:putative multidrug efflux membrane fusion protein [Vibrio ichthyoenteri ATCC 700023]|uniref:Putative multidrug efflux membrane fusion protein n=1 Tax=Vibrio ichthyoenteri ATCC 700023 TaxID=870968 RepID=F9S5Z8_9VIBR|nr:efflux RND transporter periplasmic adaptor subunit [Vibrio ichthyoenteri]EGU34463.1 putative multidrug efflux membrane fusion protein [Vibrio ichthyoenteri ATCC 700023]